MPFSLFSRWPVLFGALLLCAPCLAIVPPEYQDPIDRFHAEIETGLQLNTGNTESSSFNARTRLVYDTPTTKQEGSLSTYIASDNKSTTAERYDLQFQSDYKIYQGYIFGRGDLTWDKFGAFTRIATVSSGYGFQAIQDIDTKLSLEIGPGFRYNQPIRHAEDEFAPEAEQDVIVRLAAKFEQKFYEYTSLLADLTAESGENNNTLAFDLSYKNTFFLNWAFKVGFNVRYTEIVPIGSEQTDTSSSFNLLYTF